MRIRCLGTHNAESSKTRLISLLIDDVLAVDAGSLTSELSLSAQKKIKAILLSHGHYDHIREVPAFAFNNMNRTTKVFSSSQTLEILSSHLLDGIIYPRFAEKTPFLARPALKLHRLEPLKIQKIEDYQILSMPMNHPLDALGFEISNKEGKKVFYTGDTGPGLSSIWENISPDILVIEVTFPNRLEKITKDASHLCPKMLLNELRDFRRINNYLPRIVLVHLSPQLEKEIKEEVKDVAQELGHPITIAREGEKFII